VDVASNNVPANCEELSIPVNISPLQSCKLTASQTRMDSAKDKQEKATLTVLEQAELLCGDIAA
jgi:hypothetical protein